MADVTVFNPVFGESGAHRDPGDFDSVVVANGFAAQQVDCELMNSIIGRIEDKINFVIAQLPTEDQKAALDAAGSPSAENPIATLADALMDMDSYAHFIHHFIRKEHLVRGNEMRDGYFVFDCSIEGGYCEIGDLYHEATLTTYNLADMWARLVSIFNDYINILHDPIIKMRIKISSPTSNITNFGLQKSNGALVIFSYDSSVDSYWHAVTKSGMNITDVNTYVVCSSGAYKKFEICCEEIATQVVFKIDDVIVATITTNIEIGYYCEFFDITTLTNLSKSMSIDYFYLRQKVI